MYFLFRKTLLSLFIIIFCLFCPHQRYILCASVENVKYCSYTFGGGRECIFHKWTHWFHHYTTCISKQTKIVLALSLQKTLELHSIWTWFMYFLLQSSINNYLPTCMLTCVHMIPSLSIRVHENSMSGWRSYARVHSIFLILLGTT